jgi:hypothetical protein
LAAAADKRHLNMLIDLVQRREYGKARAMVVSSLWRYRKEGGVDRTLIRLIEDPEVSLEAMTALRRTVGNQAALPYLRRIRDSHGDERVRQHAIRQLKRAEATPTRHAR